MLLVPDFILGHSRGYALVDLPSHLRIDRAAVSVVKPPFLMRFLRFRFFVEVLWLLPASLCLLRKSIVIK